MSARQQQQRQAGINAMPAFVGDERNELDYTCIVPIEPTTGVVMIDTDLCTIRRGDRTTVANRLANYFRSAGVPARVVK